MLRKNYKRHCSRCDEIYLTLKKRGKICPKCDKRVDNEKNFNMKLFKEIRCE